LLSAGDQIFTYYFIGKCEKGKGELVNESRRDNLYGGLPELTNQ
jgi:hypothetical protein